MVIISYSFLHFDISIPSYHLFPFKYGTLAELLGALAARMEVGV